MSKSPSGCSFEDARRNHLRDGIASSTRDKVEFFETMAAMALQFGARNRLQSTDPAQTCNDDQLADMGDR